jgi:hypothetical protein
MDVLLVDDEAGIRDGMALFLRLRGYSVVTADTVKEAQQRMADQPFDVVVTDWRLPDGTAAEFVSEREGITLVISGCPRDAVGAGLPRQAVVLEKPVFPAALLTYLDAASARAAAPRAADASAALARLPIDVADRIRLGLAFLSGDLAGDSAATIDDDGCYVTVSLRLRGEGQPLPAFLGGDCRESAAAAPEAGERELEWRLFRDGRPQGVAAVIVPTERWPVGDSPFAVDLHGSSLTPESFLALLDRVAAARRGGRDVHLLNLPSAWRLHAELLGRSGDLPPAVRVGPTLTEVTLELWK